LLFLQLRMLRSLLLPLFQKTAWLKRKELAMCTVSVFLKGKSQEKVDELCVWGVSLGPN
jgi:hypothetical protein